VALVTRRDERRAMKAQGYRFTLVPSCNYWASEGEFTTVCPWKQALQPLSVDEAEPNAQQATRHDQGPLPRARRRCR